MSELEFLDVALLKRIDVETTVEGFGSKISSTFFEAANLLGTLKIKGFIDIHSSIGNSPVLMTDKGRALLKDMDVAAEEGLSRIDLAVLGNIKGGIKDPRQVESVLNVSSKDIAFSIYRLNKKGFIDYRIKNAVVELMLTAQGFEHENAEVREHAAKAEMRAPAVKKHVAAPEVRNQLAEQLAKEDIEAGEKVEISQTSRVVANISYYLTTYWYVFALVLLAILGAALVLTGTLKIAL